MTRGIKGKIHRCPYDGTLWKTAKTLKAHFKYKHCWKEP